jgi:hypothetical protein
LKEILISHGELLHQLIQIVGTTNARLKEVTDDVKQIKQDVSEIKTAQLERQRVLERLSLRSITHDVEIEELRRIK